MTTEGSGRRNDDQVTPQLELSEEEPAKTPHYAPLLSLVRFGPGSIVIMLLIAFITVELYLSGLVLFAAVTGAICALLLAVKAKETIRLSHPEVRKLIGRRCVVVKEVGKGKMGIVKLYYTNDGIGPELWSAESEHEIPVGGEAVVEGMRSIVLLIDPLD